MRNLNYRDLPTLRAAKFEPSWSGFSYFGYDKDGNQWQVEEDLDSGLLRFMSSSGDTFMTEEEFREKFHAG